MTLRTIALLCVCGLFLAACGGGTSAPYYPTSQPQEPEEPEDPGVPAPDPAVYAAAGCDSCHGDDGEGGFGPDVTCFSRDGLDAYLRTEGTAHVGGAALELTPEDIDGLVAFLDRDTCTGSVPRSHDVLRDGVPHRAGDVASCAPCHGPGGEGFGTTPSCASCHGASGALTCTGCHASAMDDGDGLPTDGRRAVVSEFAAASHHVGEDVTDDDCQVCHEMSQHQKGAVRLWNVDHPADTDQVVTLKGDPTSNADAAAQLDVFCLACHDDDGADGDAPFSTGATPVPVDSTTWSLSSHGGAALTCMGDGTTFGCHGSGHGSTKRRLLAPAGGSADGVTGDTTREEEGFCYGCHTEDGTASTDIQAEFALSHRHKVGSHDQGDDIELECTHCHDAHAATASKPLRDPDTGSAWSGTMQAFCLTCHDGTPPQDISFPTTTTGTGFDKSAFVGTTHASELGSDSCVDCHQAHGSAYRDLLLDDYVVADSNERTAGDYDACWDCHSASTILANDNAFDEYHKKHVIDEDLTCAACHDVHAPYDSGEPGLISFELAFARKWSISFPTSSTTLSSSFWTNATTGRGFCAIRCHGETHNTESYSRSSGN